jgi:hypothetical protein
MPRNEMLNKEDSIWGTKRNNWKKWFEKGALSMDDYYKRLKWAEKTLASSDETQVWWFRWVVNDRLKYAFKACATSVWRD